MAKEISYITLRAAHRFASNGKANQYVSLRELQKLCLDNNKKPYKGQGWSFMGTKADWKSCVQPYYNS